MKQLFLYFLLTLSISANAQDMFKIVDKPYNYYFLDLSIRKSDNMKFFACGDFYVLLNEDYLYSGEKYIDDTVMEIHCDQNENIWICGEKLTVINDNETTTIQLEYGKSPRNLNEDSFGNIYFTIANVGLFRVNNGDINNISKIYMQPIQLENETIIPKPYYDLLIAKDNSIWGTDTEFIYRYSENKWEAFSFPSPNDDYTWFEDDKYGNIWVRTHNYLLKFDGDDWHIIDKSVYDFPEKRISQIFKDKNGKIFVRFYDELYSIDNGEMKFYQGPFEITGSFVDYEIDSFGNIWLLNPTIVLFNPEGITTEVEEQLDRIENSMKLQPNPFDNQTVVAYEVAEPGDCDVALYDGLGNKLMSLASGWHESGSYEAEIDGTELSPGMYYVVIRTATGIETKKAVVVR